MRAGRFIFFLLCCSAFSPVAEAQFSITSAIVEFTKDSPQQQDIEIVSRGIDNQYLSAEVSEILNPGTPNEQRKIIKDPNESIILVTPDKTVLANGGRKVMRFVLLKALDASEHIYRVAIKPVIKGVNNNSSVGLKILVGYEVLVIIRPQQMQPNYTAVRRGNVIAVNNTGNTNVLFENGQQCAKPDDCQQIPVVRIYPGTTANITLPLSVPAHYAIWDGQTTTQKQFE